MRIFIGILVALFVVLQVRLWFSDDGFPAVAVLERQIKAQTSENRSLADRNARLDAEVADLRDGFSALEERARADLGLIGADESFYLLAQPEHESGQPGS